MYVVNEVSEELERVEVVTLGSCVHHEVDGRATTQDASCRDDALASGELIRFLCLVKMRVGACRHQVIEEEYGILYSLNAPIVRTGLDDEYREPRIGLSNTSSYYASCGTTCGKL